MTTFERTEVKFVPGWMAIGAMQGKTAPFDKFIGVPTSNPEPCRDNFNVGIIQKRGATIIAFAVADGISSKLNSDHGAAHAVDAALYALSQQCQNGSLDKEGFERIFAFVHQRLDEAAMSARQDLSSFGTTLIVGALDAVLGTFVCASVGDGFIVIDDGRELLWFPNDLVFQPMGAVYSITDRNWRKVLSYSRFSTPVDTVIAFTDGLQSTMFEVDRQDPNRVMRTPHRKAVEAIRSAVLQRDNVSRTRNISTLLGMRENTKLMSDDRTIVVLQNLRVSPDASNVDRTIEIRKPINASVPDPRLQARPPPIPPLVSRHNQQKHSAENTERRILSSELGRADVWPRWLRTASGKLIAVLFVVTLSLAIQLVQIFVPSVASYLPLVLRMFERSLDQATIPFP